VVDSIEVIDSPDMPPLWEVFGGQLRSDGAWTLPELSAEFASPDAALHAGPRFVILEAAAIDRAVRSAGTNVLQGVSSHVMFLARGTYGPFRFTSEVVREAGPTIAVRTPGYDDRAGGKLITAASHLFEVVD
jgi:acyl-coenzyme A thioesterase PaaI-like protein